MAESNLHAGICVGGPDWPYEETVGRSPGDVAAFLTHLGESEARCVASCGGDYLRTLYMTSTFLGADFHSALYSVEKPVHEIERSALVERLRATDTALDRALSRIKTDDLDWTRMDAFLGGVQRCHVTPPESGPAVKVLLCLVDFPPRLILEMPPNRLLPGFTTGADVLWDKYVKVHIGLVRAIIGRYCKAGAGCIGAIEIVNEPDYHWIPDENRIERSLRPDCYPLGKYVTELHVSQIPETSTPCPPFYREPGGWYVDQPLHPGLGAGPTAQPTPVLDFPWGPKFDRYVWAVAELMEHISFAAADAAHRAGVQLTLVSGAVTHNNIDYLIRMYRANPKVYRYIDAIGLHPYHWPRHDMHDCDFVSSRSRHAWQAASPRRFAEHFFKHFDFLREVSALVRLKDQKASYGMAGKRIWITEFGIPTKKASHANAAIASYRNLFIYRRGESVPPGVHTIRWEDKWDRFLDQVTPAFLRANQIDALLIYTMRSGGMGESTDEEHSNFTMFGLDCRTPRMEARTLGRLTDRFAELTGRRPRLEYFGGAAPLASGRSRLPAE